MIPNQAIDHAFAEREDLRKRIYDVIRKSSIEFLIFETTIFG